MSSLVSICIPAYRQPELLEKCLTSVFTQSFTNFEVIVTDDSPDDVVELLVRNYRERHPGMIHYYRNARPLGSPENWNEAIRKATGKYIKILHHDDWFTSPNALERFVNMLERDPRAGFAFCSTEVLELKTQKKRINTPTPDQLAQMKRDPSALFFWNFIGPPSSILYPNTPGLFFDSRVKYVVDVDFYMRLLRKNPNFAFDAEPLVTSTSQNPEQVTSHSLNAVTQVGEYAYLYNKLDRRFPSRRFLSFFKSLFLKYGIRDMAWFKENKLQAPKPTIVFSGLIRYLKFKKLYPA